MPYVTKQGRALPIDKAFTHNNKNFGATYLRVASSEEKAAEGISWETPVETPVVRPPLKREKAASAAQAKQTAWLMLNPSDWRELPSNEMPADWGAWREAVKAECRRLEAAFEAAQSYEDFDAVKAEWPLSPAEQAQQEQDETPTEDQG